MSSTKTKRVLIFSLAYFPVEGGAEIAVKQITDRLPDIDFDLVTKRFDRSHKKFEKVGNVNVHRIDSSKLFFPFKACRFARKLHKERYYDLIWSIMAAYAGLAGLLFKNKFPNVKFVLSLQEGDSLAHIKKRMSFLYPLFKRIFRRADVVQAISNFLADWGKSMGAKEVIVIPNGVDMVKFAESTFSAHGHPPTGGSGNSREKSTQLITTSRLVKKNAVGGIIEALKYLPEEVSLKILGTGPLAEVLKSKIVRPSKSERQESKRLGDRVQFLGHISYGEIPKYLHQADIFIRPSLSEGFGNSFIEAMAAGLPVIATPVGGIPDFLEDKVTGLFCEVNNPKSIAEKVMWYTNNPKLTEEIVSNAKKMVEEKYDWNLIAREMNNKVFNNI